MNKTLIALLFTLSSTAFADPNQGKFLAAQCANCHGTNGGKAGSTAPVPVLAGQKSEDIVNAMNDFKSGKRNATIMHQLAKGYNDAQIKLMADFFAAQK